MISGNCHFTLNGYISDVILQQNDHKSENWFILFASVKDLLKAEETEGRYSG